MAKRLYLNNSSTTLNGALSAAATTVTVADGSLFAPGSSYIVATIDQGAGLMEIVHVTARSGNDLTISRGEESTTDQTHPDGTTFEARITAGMLDYLDPVKDDAGKIAIGEGATSTSDDAIVIGRDASVATATGAVVIGKDAIANTSGGIAIGRAASSDGTTPAICIGDNATADSASTKSVIIGDNSATLAASNIFIGPSITCSAGDSNNIILGDNLTIIDSGMVALNAVQLSDAAVVIGQQSRAISAEQSVVMGNYAQTSSPYSVSLGTYSLNFVEGSTVMPPQVVQREQGWYYDQYEAKVYVAAPTVVASPPCDLGPGIAWSVSTLDDGDVVVPTTPNGYQYMLVIGYSASPSNYDGAYNATNTSAESTEPTWPTANQGDTVASNTSADDRFMMIDPTTGIDCAVSNLYSGIGPVKFYPTRVIFICQKYATLTAEPYISVGNENSATAYVNNQQLTGITEAHQIQYFDISNPKGADRVIFKLNTAGVGASGRMMGRFLVEGYYMQLPG